MNAYYLISRLASPAIESLFFLYSLLTRTPRARAVVRNEAGEILLLQTWPNTSTWSLPGGGVKKGELPEGAAVRELHEETGISVPIERMRYWLTLPSQGHKELVYEVSVQKADLPAVLPRQWEVREARWFSPDMLPKVTSAVHRILTEVVVGR